MPAQGQAALDLDTFDKSEMMKGIMQRVDQPGTAVIGFDDMGTSREGIFIITLLRLKGYQVDIGNGEIIVKEAQPEWNTMKS